MTTVYLLIVLLDCGQGFAEVDVVDRAWRALRAEPGQRDPDFP
jgi:hypothetical protein